MLGQAVLGFAGLAALVTLIPGIDTALVLRSAAAGGRRPALAAASGICAGVLVWGAAAAVGLAALLAASRVAYDVVRLAGAAYLVVLGLRLLLSAIRGRGARGAGSAHPPGALRSFAVGLTTNLLNPKVGVFYVAVLPQFLVPGTPPLATGLLLAGVHAVFGLVWLGLLATLADRAAGLLRRPRVVRGIDGATGGVLVAFGVVTALEPA